MASDKEFIEYICDQIRGAGEIRYLKMFGEYMVYINDKPLLLVCDNIVYIKMLDVLKEDMTDAETGTPYTGAKAHYILDIDNSEFALNIINKLEAATPIPKPKKKKIK